MTLPIDVPLLISLLVSLGTSERNLLRELHRDGIKINKEKGLSLVPSQRSLESRRCQK